MIGYDLGMEIETYPWSVGHCVRKGNKWFFVENDTGLSTFIEYEGLVLDSDHLEFLVRESLKSRALVGMN